MRALLVTLSLLVGCGASPMYDAPKPRRYVHADFKPYLEEFQNIMRSAGKHDGDIRSLNHFIWVDQFKDPSTPVVGQCQSLEYSGTFYKKRMWNIEILKREYSPNQLRELLFHELGHCIYKLDHRDDKLAIMNPYLSSEKQLVPAWDEMLQDFIDSVGDEE